MLYLFLELRIRGVLNCYFARLKVLVLGGPVRYLSENRVLARWMHCLMRYYIHVLIQFGCCIYLMQLLPCLTSVHIKMDLITGQIVCHCIFVSTIWCQIFVQKPNWAYQNCKSKFNFSPTHCNDCIVRVYMFRHHYQMWFLV